MPIGAVIGGAVIAGGATIASGAMASHAQSSAANTAASTQQNVANQNNQLARDMYESNATRLDPYSRMGLAAGDEYTGLLLGDAPKTAGTGSGWAPVAGTATAVPTSALGTVPHTTTPTTSALGTYNATSPLAAQAQAAIAAGADPAAVRARAASMGVSI